MGIWYVDNINRGALSVDSEIYCGILITMLSCDNRRISVA